MRKVGLQITIEAEGCSHNSDTLIPVPIDLLTDGTVVTITIERPMTPVSLTPFGWKQVAESAERMVEDAREISAKY